MTNRQTAILWLWITILPTLALHTMRAWYGLPYIYLKHAAIVSQTYEAPGNERVLPYYFIEFMTRGHAGWIVFCHLIFNAVLLGVSQWMIYRFVRSMTTTTQGLLASAVLGQLLMLTTLHVGGALIESWTELAIMAGAVWILCDWRSWWCSPPLEHSPEIRPL